MSCWFTHQRSYRSESTGHGWLCDYLRGRHLSVAIAEVGIGYAPPGWTRTGRTASSTGGMMIAEGKRSPLLHPVQMIKTLVCTT